MPLKDLEVRYAAKRSSDYKLADGDGLHLLSRSNGSKLWRLKYRFGGREKLLWFGAYPAVGLVLAEGGGPGAKAPRKVVMTFEAAARAWHTNREASLEAGHAARVLTRLERDAFPAFGKTDVRAVTAAAARICGVGLQIVRDWVVRFTPVVRAFGMARLPVPGPRSRLDDAQRRALVAVVEGGPIPAIHGIVRWRLIDLLQWLYEEFAVSLDEATVARELKKLGYVKHTARPRDRAQNEFAMEAFKKGAS